MLNIIISLHKESLLLGFKNILPIMPSVIGFGLIFGLTGGSGTDLPLIIISSMSFIIFAGSAQFVVLLAIIAGEPLLGLLLAGILINTRHLLYGANLNEVIEAKGLKKVIIAYLLTDEAFLITNLTKKRLEENPEPSRNYNLDDVLIGAGFTLWSIWNLTTIVGYLLSEIVERILTLHENFIISATFLGYLIMHWLGNPDERKFIVILAIFSIILGFLIDSSALIISILMIGILYTIVFFSRFQNSKEKIQSVQPVED
ncbi:MAG: AzlC family ABC transporter permease [Candidatus Hodarchaeales archaeon]